MTTTDAAQLLGVNTRTVARWCDLGMICATWWSGHGRHGYRRITPAALLTALRDSRHSHMRAVVGKRQALRAMHVLNKAAQVAGKDGG